MKHFNIVILLILKVSGGRDPINARNCGLATVLTTLCMIDPELNVMDSTEINQRFSEDQVLETTVKTACHRFIGLTMAADPMSGAFAYFSAALNTNYDKFLIRTDCEQDNHYTWMDTKTARNQYDVNTGKIGGIRGYMKQWFFCDAIEGKFPEIL